MADFRNSINVILKHEGLLSEDPDDPGGVTNYGVSLRFALAELQADGDHDGWKDGDFDHDGDVDADDIRKMTVANATNIYCVHWWLKHGYDRIKDDTVATKLLDCSVNMGWKQAHKLAQRAANGCGAVLRDDGNLGALSVAAINGAPARWFLLEYSVQMENFYLDLTQTKPKLGKYIPGWTKRAMWPFYNGA